MSRFAPKDFEEAVQNRAQRPPQPRQPISRGKGFQRRSGLQGRQSAQQRPVRAKIRTVDPELVAWAIRVKKRDGYKCQWAGCVFWHDQLTVYVAHHKALRSARPDLRLVDDNGVTVCWDRHNVIHSPEGHDEAVRRGFLNTRTRELAAKEGTLGIY